MCSDINVSEDLAAPIIRITAMNASELPVVMWAVQQ